MEQSPYTSESVFDTQTLFIADTWVKTEKQHLLQNVLFWLERIFIIIALLMFIRTLLSPTVWQLWTMTVINIASLGVYRVALTWGRQGRTIAGSRLIIITLMMNAVGMAVLFDKLLVAYGIMGSLIALLASVLISVRTGYIFSLAFTITGLLILLLQEYNLLTTTYPTSNATRNIADVSIYVFSVLIGMYLVTLNQEGTRRALKQLIARSNELKSMNKRLGHEIVERKRAETALAELNTSLEAQVATKTSEIVAEKDKSDAILSSVGDAISVTNLAMQIQYVNQAFTKTTGYTAGEVIGQSIYMLFTENTLAEEKAFALNQEQCTGLQVEMVARRKDGRCYDAQVIIAPVRNAEGERIGYVFSQQDISHFKNLERARHRFITNVSHELRTPVTIIRLAVHLLEMNTEPEKLGRALDTLQKQSMVLERLIKDILEITSLDSGNVITVWEPVFLPALMDEVLLNYQSQLEAQNLAVHLQHLPEDVHPTLKGDQARLIQALQELLENAINFTPTGGDITIEAELTEDDVRLWATIAVRDTGPGIPIEEQFHVFDRFFRGSIAESGHIPGTGLGLSIVDEIMRAHGGRVTVESQPGAGSMFKLWLPVNEEAQNVTRNA
ncbi:MAG: PAS domain S-box protein [Anaerolineae bacterium]|nr:PAS domain S-box protein [Anaerolineae bacterium]